MIKILLVIPLLLSAFAVMTQGVLVYQYSATATIIAAAEEEETLHDKPILKEGKELGNERIGYTFYLYGQSIVNILYKVAMRSAFRCSKGFCRIPYNPPDISCITPYFSLT